MDVIYEFLKEEIDEEELKTDFDTQFRPAMFSSKEDQQARSDKLKPLSLAMW